MVIENDNKEEQNLTKGQKVMIHVRKLQKYIEKPEIVELKNNSQEEFEKKCKEKFSELNSKYPNIFIKAIDKMTENDVELLKMMLTKYDLMNDNKLTEQTASEQIGKVLADIYVNPLVDQSKEKS